MEKPYWRYWGKARKVDEYGAPYHLLVYHCLDVAAIGAAYLERHTHLLGMWAARLSVAAERLASWIIFFLALHDLGKFSYRFQGLQPHLPRLLDNVQPPGDYTIRHDTLGQIVFETKIRPLIIELGGPYPERQRGVFGTVQDQGLVMIAINRRHR
jgi:CRISPR-associated endonuclease/helicase Cas3